MKIKVFKIGLNKNKLISVNSKIRKEVTNCKRYLYLGATFIKSSKKLINIKGIHKKDNETLFSELLK